MLARPRWIPWVCASLAIALLTSGCRRGPKLSPVTGTVTLDGKPLANAEVEFQPTQGAAPSYGTTDALGQYELRYTKDKLGAVVGGHVVRITTQTTVVDPETGEESQIPQRVPEKYNYLSELIRQVQSEPNIIDFRLESEPEEEEPPEKEPIEEEPGEQEPGEKKPDAEQPDAEKPDAEVAEVEQPMSGTPQPGASDKEAAAAEFAEVSGTVTLNGQPLVGADVEFQPREGAPSYGVTDENGRYELMYTRDKKGAIVGEHVVRITTTRIRSDPEGKEEGELAEVVPPKYNAQSELSVKVLPGKNTFDFVIET